MSLPIADRIKETSTSTGTGNFTLLGAATGYKTFTSSLADPASFYYCIENLSSGEWEVGEGHLSGPNTLVRDTLLTSSTGAFVSFSAGVKTVFNTVPAGRFTTLVMMSVIAGLSLASTSAIANGDTVLQALGKAQAQIDTKINAAAVPAAVLATPLTGLSLASGSAITATDTVLAALGKTQAQLNLTATSAALALKLNTANPAFTGSMSGAGDLSLGIGAATPYAAGARLLHVHSTGTSAEVKLTNSTTGSAAANGMLLGQYGVDSYLWNGSGGQMVFGTSNMARLVLSAAGNASFLGNVSVAGALTAGSATFSGAVTGVTAAMVGLGNVDNTSDANKPISTAAAAALALKAPLASPAFTGTVTGITAAMVGLGSVDNTSDAAKPISTATAAALALKLNAASPAFTGTLSGPALSLSGNGSVGGTLGVAGVLTAGGVAVTVNASIGGTLAVTGATTLAGLTAATGAFGGAITQVSVLDNNVLGGVLNLRPYNSGTVSYLDAGHAPDGGDATLQFRTLVAGVETNSLLLTGAGASLPGALSVSGATTMAALTATTGVFSGTVTAASFVGTMTGSSSLNVLKSGDTMTGPLVGTSFSYSGNGTVGGALGVAGVLSAGGAAITVNATIGGTLNVAGATTIAALSATTGAFSGAVTIGAISAVEPLNVGGNVRIPSGSAFYWGDATAQIVAATGSGGNMRFLTGNASARVEILGSGEVGIGPQLATTAQKLLVSGGHSDSRIQLYSAGDGSSNYATLNLWASEPGFTYTGVGISNNVLNYNGSASLVRQNTTTGGSYIRLLDNAMTFAVVDSSGVARIALDVDSSANLSVTYGLTVGRVLGGTSAAFSGALAAASLTATSNAAVGTTLVVGTSVRVGAGAAFTPLGVTGNISAYSAGVSSVGSPLGAQLYLGDANFAGGSYFDSAPGIGALWNGGVAGDLGLYVYNGVANSRLEVARFTAAGPTLQGTARITDGTKMIRLRTDAADPIIDFTNHAQSAYLAAGLNADSWKIYANGVGIDINTSGNVSLGGTLTVTSAFYSNQAGAAFQNAPAGTSARSMLLGNDGGSSYFGMEGSTAGGYFTGSQSYATVVYGTTPFQVIIGGTARLTIGTSGAATFSSTLGVAGILTAAGLAVTVNATVGGTLNVAGATTLAALAAATGAFSGAVSAASFSGPLTGAASANVLKAGDTMTGALNGTSFSFSGNGAVGGTLGVTGVLTAAGLAVTVNTSVGGTLTVAGATALAALGATTGSFSGTVTASGALNVTGLTSLAGQLSLTNSTSNLLSFAAFGAAAPTFTTRSIGTKIVLYPGIGASTVDYAFGITGSALWASVPNTATGFHWYGGTTLAAVLTGAGSMTLVGGLAAVNGAFSGTMAVTGAATFSSTISASTISAATFAYLGSAGSGTGGNVRYLSDDGASKWLTGLLGTVGARNFSIYDIANSASRLTINGTTGAITVAGLSTSSLGLVSAVTDGVAYALGLAGTTKGMRAEASSTCITLRGVDSTLTASYQPLGIGGSYVRIDAGGATEVARFTLPAAGTGSLDLKGTTANFVNFGTAGGAAPAFNTRSAGTKLVLYENIGASAADYALGIESGAMWFSVASTGNSYKWYGATSLAATLTGVGNLTLVGQLVAASARTTGSIYAGAAGIGSIGLIFGDATASGYVTVQGGSGTQVAYFGYVPTAGAAMISQSTGGHSFTGGPISMGNNLSVTGNGSFSGTLGVTGVATVGGLAVTVNATVGGTLGVTGATTLAGLTATTGTFAGAVTAANLVFSGTGARIQGVLNGATLSDRLMVQGSVTNGNSVLGIIPNGTGTLAGYAVYNSSNPSGAAAYGLLQVDATAVKLISSLTAGGTILPLKLVMGVTDVLTIDTAGASTFGSDLAISGTTASTSPTTGALKSAGGLGVAGSSFIGGNESVAGSIRAGAGTAGGGGLAGDIISRRSSTAGAYYFGESATAYLYADSSGYYFGGTTSLNLGGALVQPAASTATLGTVVTNPAASVTLTVNGSMTIQATSNTTATLKYRGSDGVTRSVNFTLT